MSETTITSLEAQAPPPAIKKRVGFLRMLGVGLCAFWVLVAIGLVWSLVSSFDYEVFAKYFPRMMKGLLVTIQLVVFSVIIGGVLAMFLAMARLSPSAIIRKFAFGYVYFFRGTPLLAQMFLMYYGAGQFVDELKSIGLWWFFREAYNCVMFAFILNTTAYQAEIYKTAIESIPRGQGEAGRSLGLHENTIFRKIIMPQAMITALRPLGNEIIFMIKGSAVASLVTVFDLMGATKLAFSRTFDFNIYLWAAIVYFLIVEVLRRVWARLEAHLTRHLER